MCCLLHSVGVKGCVVAAVVVAIALCPGHNTDVGEFSLWGVVDSIVGCVGHCWSNERHGNQVSVRGRGRVQTSERGRECCCCC